MSVIWTSRTRTRQPSGVVRGKSSFTPQHPLILFNFASGVAPPNAGTKTGLTWSTSSGASIVAGTAGVGYKNATSTAGSIYGGSQALLGFATSADGAWSVLSFTGANYVSQGSGLNYIAGYADSADFGGHLAYINSSNVLGVGCDMVGSALLTGPTIVAGKQYSIVWGRDAAGSFSLWVNGALYSSSSGSNSNDSSTALSIYVGGHVGSTRAYAGSIALYGIGSGSPNAFGSVLSANPWQLFVPEKRPILIGSAAAGANNTGALVSTLGDVTLAGIGGAARSGTLATTLDAATLAGIGGVATSGTLAVTLDAATLTGVGAVTTSGTLSSTLEDATLAGVGSVAVGTNRDGALAVTLDAATLTGVGAVTTSGTLAVTLDAATLAGIGTAGQAITGTLAVTLDNATLSGIGAIPAAPSTGGGKTTGKNLSRKQKKKLKAVESQEWLKAEETARQLLSDRFTKQTPQEKAQALETYIESLQPVIEALKALTSQIEEVVEEAPVIELTPHQEVIQRFDRLEKKVKSVEELIIILMADL